MAIAILLIFKPASIFASTNQLQKALELESKNPESAIPLFSNISPKDPNYKFAIEELLKIHYQLSNWPEFFAYAQFYRKTYKIEDRDQTQLLEILALLRHCQNELVIEFVEAYKVKLPKFKDKLDQMKMLAQTRFKGKGAPKKSVTGLASHLAGVSLWPLSHSEIARADPRRMRIEVVNRCY